MGLGCSHSASRRHMTVEDIVDECGEDSRIKCLHILFTAVTSSIGIETSQALAFGGAKAYLMARNGVKLQEVLENINKELQQKSSSGSVQDVICDLNSLPSVKNCRKIYKRKNAFKYINTECWHS